MSSAPNVKIIERSLIKLLMETLQGLPEVRSELDMTKLDMISSNNRFDSQINLKIGKKSYTLNIESKKSIFPRDAHQVVRKFREIGSQPSGKIGCEVVPLLVAEAISPGAKELLREEHIGYFDRGGSLFMPADGAYIYIDKPAPKTISNSISALFSGSRAQVLHVLLAQHQGWFSVTKLAELAMVSPATTSKVMTELERFDWIASRGQGPNKERQLSEPALLLDSWARQVTSIPSPTFRRFYIPVVKPEDLLELVANSLDGHRVEYAISYEAAAQRYAPFLSSVSQVRCRIIASHASESAISALGARVVSEGANLLTTEAQSNREFLFREQIAGIWLDSPIHVYLDLLRGEGRAKEMAEHLRKERIGF